MGIDRARAVQSLGEFLVAIGRDPRAERELEGTAERVTDLFLDELCAGYAVDVDALVRANQIAAHDGGAPVVTVAGLDVVTTCPHHLLPSFGKATVAYAPRSKLIGVGAVAQLAHALARRLSLQETLSDDLAGALARGLEPAWVACRVTLTHGCMAFRGERASTSTVTTVSFVGDAASRSEGLALLAGTP